MAESGTIRLRLLRDPAPPSPDGSPCRFGLQDSKGGIQPGVEAGGGKLRFDFELNVREGLDKGRPLFTGASCKRTARRSLRLSVLAAARRAELCQPDQGAAGGHRLAFGARRPSRRQGARSGHERPGLRRRTRARRLASCRRVNAAAFADLSLSAHPDTPSGAVRFIGVQLQRERSGLHLHYVVEGDAKRIVLPPPQKPYRADELWQTTCFELFVHDAGDVYREFNFSPSSQWAAYAFTSYRAGREALALDQPPTVRFWPEFERPAHVRVASRRHFLGRQNRTFRRDRGDGRHQILLGTGTSAGSAGLPSSG